MGATVARLLIQYRKPIGQVILGFFVFILLIFILIFNNNPSNNSSGMATENQNLSESVLRYKGTVEKYAKQYGGSEYVPYILALMQIESGGNGGDPMQSSESLGLAPNTIQDPEKSIQRGVEFFIENMKSAIGRGADIKTALQAYNYGGGFVDFVVKNGGTYSFELAKQFSINMSGGQKVSYVNTLSTSMGYDYRYNYGNMFYVPKLLEFVIENQASANGVQNNSNNSGAMLLDVPNDYKNKLRYPKYDGHNYNTSGSYPFGQCTWYAFNRMSQIGKRVGDYMGNGGEWGRQAEIFCTYMAKGKMVGIEGKIIADRYKNENGENRYITRVRANSFRFL